MKIRARLTLIFTVAVATVILFFSLAIYLSSSIYRKNEFSDRLRHKAQTTARLLLEIDEVDANLLKIIDRNNLTSLPNEKIVVYDVADALLYGSDDQPSDAIPSKPLLTKIRQQKEVYYAEGDAQVLGLLFNYDANQYVILASATDVYGLSKLRNLRLILISASLVSLLVLALIGWIFAGRAIQPIAEVVQEVEQITAVNMDRRVGIGNGKDEIAQLAITFNQMLDRLQGAFESQRAFVSNASHELRTPLTIITGQIDVTLLKRRTPEEYEDLLRLIRHTSASLTQLSNQLLSLAQVTSEGNPLSGQLAQVDELIYQAALQLSGKNPSYRTTFEFENTTDPDPGDFVVWGDEDLLKTAFYNLMENACKFSGDHQVRILLGFSQGQVKVQFVDKGIGVPANELEQIFQPFFRAENSTGTNGHGIGLSLTLKIIALHKGKIALHSTLGQGSSFIVTLPART